MPPKRKRVEPSESTPKATTSRRSTRSSGDGTNEAVGPTLATGSTIIGIKSKARVAAKSTFNETSEKRAGSDRRSRVKQRTEEYSQLIAETEENFEPSRKKGKVTAKGIAINDVVERSSKALLDDTIKSAITPPAVKQSPYAKAQMEQLFTTYADVEDLSFIGSEGFEKLCLDAGIPMEGAQPLILAWMLEASELGKLTETEWSRGFDGLRIDTLDKLRFALSEYEALLLSKAPVPKVRTPNKRPIWEPYNRDLNYWHYVADVPGAFLRFYNFVFCLAKAPQERNIDVEIAKVFWSTLLSEKYPLANDLIEYLNARPGVKGVNKDLWTMSLDFFQCVGPSLEGYDSEGAWPTLLDEFVAWKRGSSVKN